MNILHFSPASDGCTWYRQTLPLRALDKLDEVHVFEIKPTVSDRALVDAVNAADVLFIRASNSGLEAPVRMAKQANPRLAIVADTDDDLTDISPMNNAFQTMGQYEVKDAQGNFIWQHGQKGFDLYKNWQRLVEYRWHLRIADVVTTTTPFLRERLLEHNDMVAVIPNGLFPEDFPLVEMKNHTTVRLVWAGGSSHFEDLMMVKPAIKRLMEDLPQVELHIAGQRFGSFMKGLPESRVFYYPWVHPSGHGFRLATIGGDIGLAPLEDKPFNHAKSSIKYFEYSALGLATVASNTLPYSDDIQGTRGVLADPQHFYESLKELVLDPMRRLSLARESREWVIKERGMDVLAKDWLELFTAAATAAKERHDQT